MFHIIFEDKPSLKVPIQFGILEQEENEYNYDIEYHNLMYNRPPIYFPDDRVGEKFINYNGSYVEMIDYERSKAGVHSCITTVYDDKVDRYLKTSDSKEFYARKLKSPFDRSIYGVGYLGIGQYGRTSHLKYYDHFHDMMKRCYSDLQQTKTPGYNGCSVDPYFHNFQNFCYWCDNNYYQVPNQRMELDKDTLFKGNMVYGPDTCVFVPSHINALFTKSNRIRGKYPIGVTKSGVNSYVASISIKGYYGIDIPYKNGYIGSFKTPEEAFDAYKDVKENEIKRVADLYKDYIPYRLYLAMYNYKVEIDD